VALNAVVFCNCFEKGRLREPPPVGCRLAVVDDGSLVCGNGDFFVQAAFANWLHDRACDHFDGRLVHLSLGDVEEIAALRAILKGTWTRCPTLFSRVLQYRTHESEVIAPHELGTLRAEVTALGDIHLQDREMERLLRAFESRMAELLECAMFANKPIVF
jgi:hypothetical protein